MSAVNAQWSLWKVKLVELIKLLQYERRIDEDILNSYSSDFDKRFHLYTNKML